MKPNPTYWAGLPPALSRRLRLLELMLIFCLVIPLLLGAGTAQFPNPPDDPPAVPGGFTAIAPGGDPAANSAFVANPSLPTAGALIYEDFIKLERKAYNLLKPNLEFRESISPYNSKPDYLTLVQKFDYQAGLASSPYTDTLGTVTTIQARIDKADRELRQARDLYAFLAVYAPESRFRQNSVTDGINYTTTLCGEGTTKEMPNPPDPAKSGQVLPPVVDWCDFKARLRQSVREAANIRMIFGQQFVTDALELAFSGDFKGADDFVRQEIAKLRAAENQYELVEAGIAEALDRPLGSGCLVSDFFTQTEWSLLLEAAASKETAQHHIAIRQSYLGEIDKPEDKSQYPDPQALAVKVQNDASSTYRASLREGHIKLIGMAGIGASAPAGMGCAQGERPDGLLVAEMALNMLKTRDAARNLAENRNIFGFNVTLVPARPYSKPASSGQTGLLEDAYALAEEAKDLQKIAYATKLAFDNTQQKLIDDVDAVRSGVDNEIYATFGCAKPSPGTVSDGDFFTCAEQQIEYLNICLNSIQSPTVENQPSAFDTCMADPKVKEGDAKRSLLDLRGVWLEVAAIKLKIDNLSKRIKLSKDANVKVTASIIADGVIQTAFQVADAVSDAVETVVLSSGGGTITKPGSVAAGLAAAAAGASSTAAAVVVQDAGVDVEIGNLLLDISESYVDWQVAHQAYLAKKSEFEDLIGDDLLMEARKQRAYLQYSSANDPSHRIVRDSARLQVAAALERASRIAYLAARRAEYEYAVRLSASGFAISKIYKARTAEDVKQFLLDLSTKINSLKPTSPKNPIDYEISVAQYVVGLTDAALRADGFTTPEAILAERTKRFREWVADHTIADPESGGKPALLFSFPTNIQDGGIFANVYGPGYSGLWLQQMAAVGDPNPVNKGVRADVVSAQTGLERRTIRISQSGLVQVRANSGCILDYRLVAPAFLLGLEWSEGQNPEKAFAQFQARVNNEPTNSTDVQANELLGRGIASTEWTVKLFTGGAGNLADMDLQQLNDVVLKFSATYVSRDVPNKVPKLSECVKIDF
ncbi:MAG: hypothetical protein KJZ86_17855 [Caldilineaceae bacterium]|nr:hypothetical protein [Caldilineaceae bacterium]HRJ40754.1 hypothetical protein [Caldilineaceae bacterium]